MSSIFRSADIQRYYRDVNSGAQQIFLNWDSNATIYGKVALGIEARNVRW